MLQSSKAFFYSNHGTTVRFGAKRVMDKQIVKYRDIVKDSQIKIKQHRGNDRVGPLHLARDLEDERVGRGAMEEGVWREIVGQDVSLLYGRDGECLEDNVVVSGDDFEGELCVPDQGVLDALLVHAHYVVANAFLSPERIGRNDSEALRGDASVA